MAIYRLSPAPGEQHRAEVAAPLLVFLGVWLRQHTNKSKAGCKPYSPIPFPSSDEKSIIAEAQRTTGKSLHQARGSELECMWVPSVPVVKVFVLLE